VPWSRICLALLDDRLWVKEKTMELIWEVNNKWLCGVILRSGSQRRATMSDHVTLEGRNERLRSTTSGNSLKQWPRARPRDHEPHYSRS
jgi:hypothetical protein